MVDKEMHRFQDILENEMGLDVRSYSGRGMYGKQCLGVEVSRGGLGDFIADVFEAVAGNEDDATLAADAFRSMSTDSMGLDTIVYFTQVPFSSSDADEDDE